MDNPRVPSAPVDRLFLDRWSPRAFDPAALPAGTIETLIEAVRWAPSCFNEQPWLVVWGVSVADRERILGIMNERNRSWAATAPLLAVLFARRKFDRNGRPNRWAGFDAGAGWMSLALQARLLGLYSHAMGGFNAEQACTSLGVPEADYEAMCCIAIGRLGDPKPLPEELRAGEGPKNERKTPGEISSEGMFRKG
jgi:nitroreductase